MPYVRKGKTVYKKVDGLKKKGSSKTTVMAKKYMRALYHAEGGGEFTKSKKKGKQWYREQYKKRKK